MRNAAAALRRDGRPTQSPATPSTRASAPTPVLREGTGIVNARGVPGTLGCLVRTRDEGRIALLTAHHVLFGAEAREQDAVALAGAASPSRMSAAVAPSRMSAAVAPSRMLAAAPPEPPRIATARWGRRGTVRHDVRDVHVDCAIAMLDDARAAGGWREERETPRTAPRAGDRVTKLGAATGATAGVVADPDYTATVTVGGVPRAAPGQLLIRAYDESGGRRPFSARGDSGALVRDARGAIVGLLWGTAPDGASLACPIAPVLWVLHVAAMRYEPTAESAGSAGSAA